MSRTSYLIAVVLLVLVLGAQAATSGYAVLAKALGWPPSQLRTWPFMDYPMYSAASGPPVSTNDAMLVAVLPNGNEVRLDDKALGLKFFAWRFRVVERLVAEPGPADDPTLAALIEEHRAAALAQTHRALTRLGHRRPERLVVRRNVFTLRDGEIVRESTEEPVRLDAAPSAPAAVSTEGGSDV